MNARLWIHCKGFVKVTLKPGQVMNWAESHSTEEGYHSESITLEYLDDVVYITEVESGRDCDGEHSSTYSHHCPIDQLQADYYFPVGQLPASGYIEPVCRPAWQKTRPTRCYDQYAEMAGY